ncbi:hypothetical protein H5410_061425 [Solanum commersonii]|uniref:Uncharacterized protein n=1 Tax=Solanum commersonii TaxID=4109 RepID=A0A9J5W7P7_SOLCO|nr:hypothetical protein H5410_061425 [Solanum commersonii]
MRSSRTPTSRMKKNLRFNPLTLSISINGYTKLSLKTSQEGIIQEIQNMCSERSFGDSPFGLVRRLSSVAFNIFVSWIIGRCSTASQSCSAIHRLLFSWPICSFPSGLSTLEQKANMRSIGDSPNGFVQSFKKGVLNSATQDSIMNSHNKAQFTFAKIKCSLKDSSSDSPI